MKHQRARGRVLPVCRAPRQPAPLGFTVAPGDVTCVWCKAAPFVVAFQDGARVAARALGAVSRAFDTLTRLNPDPPRDDFELTR